MKTLDYSKYNIGASAILTGSYVYDTFTTQYGSQTYLGPDQIVENNNQMILLVDFTLGSLTTGDIVIEFSADASNWYSESYDDITAATGVITQRAIVRKFGATGKYRIAVPIKDRYVRVGAKGTGTATDSLMAITAIIGIS